jgi:hypothetical protein
MNMKCVRERERDLEREREREREKDYVCWLMGGVENGLEGDLLERKTKLGEGWLVFLSLTLFWSFSMHFSSLTR